jgi:hypothetical protein
MEREKTSIKAKATDRCGFLENNVWSSNRDYA